MNKLKRLEAKATGYLVKHPQVFVILNSVMATLGVVGAMFAPDRFTSFMCGFIFCNGVLGLMSAFHYRSSAAIRHAREIRALMRVETDKMKAEIDDHQRQASEAFKRQAMSALSEVKDEAARHGIEVRFDGPPDGKPH